MEDVTGGYYSWHEQFYYFTLFKALNGPDAAPSKESNMPIDNDTYYTQADLYAWIRDQNASRKCFLDGQPSNISANQIKVLDSVNFPWIRDSSERWDAHFQLLLKFKEENGHTNVSRRSKKEGDKALGVWVKNQRAAYHKVQDQANGRLVDSNVKKTTAIITADQIKMLDEIGFQWKIRPEHSDVWDASFQKMKAFIEEHGHSRVSPQTHADLGRWACVQRYRYKKRAEGEKPKISDEQIARLEGIGFKWEKGGVDPEEKKRRQEENQRLKNEKRKRERAEKKAKRQEEAKNKKERKKQKVIHDKKVKSYQVATQIKSDLEKKLASLKEREKERLKNPEIEKVKKVSLKEIAEEGAKKEYSSKDIEKSVGDITNDIDKKLAAGNIPVVSEAVKLAANVGKVKEFDV